MNIWSAIAITVVGLAAAFFAIGPDRVWMALGPPDLGAVDFATLQRRTTPNDALACPPGKCAAKADITPPVYAVSAAQLRTAFARMIAVEPRVVMVAGDDPGLTERYIQRSRLMRFPDTVVVRYFDLPGGRSTIALYSRSQLGTSDLGVNRARVERWLDRLAEEASAQSAK